jgi:hypothetical protein
VSDLYSDTYLQVRAYLTGTVDVLWPPSPNVPDTLYDSLYLLVRAGLVTSVNLLWPSTTLPTFRSIRPGPGPGSSKAKNPTPPPPSQNGGASGPGNVSGQGLTTYMATVRWKSVFGAPIPVISCPRGGTLTYGWRNGKGPAWWCTNAPIGAELTA